jgi:hypothetical protein
MDTTPKRLLAGRALFLTLAIALAFHLLVLAGVLPSRVVWGGRLTEPPQIIAFESASTIVILAMLGVSWRFAGLPGMQLPSPRASTVSMASMSLFFALNTIGNLFSVSPFERALFSPITLLLSLLSLYLATSTGKHAGNRSDDR